MCTLLIDSLNGVAHHLARNVGLDLLSPVYNVLDLTPQSRGDWYASLGYAPLVKGGATEFVDKAARKKRQR
jgi:predicted dithiol-disulfide oxidoreductase (DUF899 family)